MFLAVKHFGFIKQEPVDVVRLIQKAGARFAVHRPHSEHPNKYELWCVSELETGTIIAIGMSQEYAILKATKYIEDKSDKIQQIKSNFFKNALLIF